MLAGCVCVRTHLDMILLLAVHWRLAGSSACAASPKRRDHLLLLHLLLHLGFGLGPWERSEASGEESRVVRGLEDSRGIERLLVLGEGHVDVENVEELGAPLDAAEALSDGPRGNRSGSGRI